MLVYKLGLADQKIKVSLRSPIDVDSGIDIDYIDYNGNLLKSTKYSILLNTWTLSSNAGAGTQNPKQLSLTNYANLTTGKYFLINGNMYERIGISYHDGVKAVLSYPISTFFPTGSALVPAFFNLTVPQEVVENETKFTAKIQYIDVFGNVIGYYSDGYVTKNPALNPATIEDIEKIWPQLGNMQQTGSIGREEMAEKLDSAWNSVISRIMSVGIMPEQVHAVTLLKEIVIYEFAKILSLSGNDPTGQKNPFDFGDKVEQILKNKWNEFFNTEQFIDTDKNNKKTEQMMFGRRVEW